MEIKDKNTCLLLCVNKISEQIRSAKAMAQVMLNAQIGEIHPSTCFDYWETLHNILIQADQFTEKVTSEILLTQKEKNNIL